MNIIKRIIEKIADGLGLIDKWKQKGKNEICAEISILDRHLAGFCSQNDLDMPTPEVIESLKYYLMDSDSYLKYKGYNPDEVGKRGVKFINSLLDNRKTKIQ